MHRVYLTYLGHGMELPVGETLLGRSLACRVRFNDPGVSREHALLRVSGARVTIEDLGSRNGTYLNGQPVSRRAELTDGDKLRIGSRQLEITIAGDEFGFDPATVRESPPPEPQPPVDLSGRQQRCPECKQPVTTEDDQCSGCGFSWADFRPGSVTRKIPVAAYQQARDERRRHTRHRVEVPVLYSSENLAVETMALNLSKSGIFIRTQILDEVGTPCELTVMADGGPALTLPGRVMRVVEVPSAEEPLGLGIEFNELGPAERRWLDQAIARLSSAA